MLRNLKARTLSLLGIITAFAANSTGATIEPLQRADSFLGIVKVTVPKVEIHEIVILNKVTHLLSPTKNRTGESLIFKPFNHHPIRA
jgi:hypothetical protein